jgi:hypothetical protein
LAGNKTTIYHLTITMHTKNGNIIKASRLL